MKLAFGIAFALLGSVPSTALAEDAVRRYKVTRAFSPWTPQERVYEDQGKLVTDWVWRGFNATLVSFGQQGTGKSYTLYRPLKCSIR